MKRLLICSGLVIAAATLIAQKPPQPCVSYAHMPPMHRPSPRIDIETKAQGRAKLRGSVRRQGRELRFPRLSGESQHSDRSGGRAR